MEQRAKSIELNPTLCSMLYASLKVKRGVNHDCWFLKFPWLFLAHFMSRFFGARFQCSVFRFQERKAQDLTPETSLTNGFDLHPVKRNIQVYLLGFERREKE